MKKQIIARRYSDEFIEPYLQEIRDSDMENLPFLNNDIIYEMELYLDEKLIKAGLPPHYVLGYDDYRGRVLETHEKRALESKQTNLFITLFHLNLFATFLVTGLVYYAKGSKMEFIVVFFGGLILSILSILFTSFFFKQATVTEMTQDEIREIWQDMSFDQAVWTDQVDQDKKG